MTILEELQLCQRYFEHSWPYGEYLEDVRGNYMTTSTFIAKQDFATSKILAPSLTTYTINNPITEGYTQNTNTTTAPSFTTNTVAKKDALPNETSIGENGAVLIFNDQSIYCNWEADSELTYP